MTEYDGFRVERDEARSVATITLDVPEKMNRVSMAAREQLAALFAELGADTNVHVIVLTGAGDKAFTAGGDIPGFMEKQPEHLSRLHWNVAAPERCPKPVVCAIRGFCLGVGLELALACDFRVCTDDAQLGLPEIGLGMIPGSGGTQRLARLIGLSRAKDVIMRRKRISAQDALAWGLVSEVVPAPTSSTTRSAGSSTICSSSRRSRSRSASAFSTSPTTARCTSASRSRASRTGCCARPRTSPRAWTRSSPSARPPGRASRAPNRKETRPAGCDGCGRGKDAGSVRIRRIRARPRTQHRASKRGQTAQCFVLLGALSRPAARRRLLVRRRHGGAQPRAGEVDAPGETAARLDLERG